VKALSDVDLDLRPGEVLGLCGENGAGKSTLMKVLTGIHKSDPGGEIWLQGEKVDIQSPEHARDLGLSIIHQELNIVPDLTVAQNLYIGRPGTSKFGYVDDRKMVRDARELFERLNMDIDPTAHCRDLPVARLQMVEIARALSFDSKILVMDEPTAPLTTTETESLFELVRDFVCPTTGLIFITHRMPELTELTNSAPGLNLMTLRAGISMTSLVRGLTPLRADFSTTVKDPKPRIEIFSPFSISLRMVSTIASTAFFPSALLSPAFADTASMNSVLFIILQLKK